MRDIRHNFVVVALMIIKFGTSMKLDAFYTIVTTSLCRHYYYIIMTYFSQCVGLNFRCQNPLTDLTEIWNLKVFWSAGSKYQVFKTFKISL